MRPDTGRAGVVVAGGRSTRFGDTDKATVRVDGVPMIRRVVDGLAPAVDEIVVNCRRGQRPAFEAALSGLEVRFAEDPILDRGPVAGLRTGLQATTAEYAAVVACDMPFVPTALVDHLFAAARTHTGAVPEIGGQRQPFPAVVHVRAGLTACADAFVHQRGRLCEVVDVLDPVVVPERTVRAYADSAALRNINTRADLYEARVRT
ncbi:molybdopterin-guanine dinucleotide biosynthesis protein A [Halogranum rubrum]|uniref:Probable molybdenum cofactor guanylyltransferase n=1 Tax=Halogranum rubrum TaxID=553466 RepID=A0A1I4AXE1_9EURY|nr:molybdenum cofactor guanylyltransferase [Halogranum rubrum]SFK60587.1 molybdopterin-guanine dinucleotide biosynthesis protein A [Halogranum rubrum]